MHEGDLRGVRLAIAGAGVLGLSTAVLAARCGARVCVFDPRGVGENASGVAAGMLAPAFEAALDGPPDRAAEDFTLFQAAYAAWPSFAESLGVSASLEAQAGGLYIAPSAPLQAMAGRLSDLGAEIERLTAAQARTLQPALAPTVEEALHVRNEGRVNPGEMLGVLSERLREAGGEVARSPCPPPPAPGFDATILAAGYQTRHWIGLAPGLAALQPIKGHVLHFQGGPREGPTVRGSSGYAAPQRAGTIFGATMEPDRHDETLDPARIAHLHAAAIALLPGLAGTPFVARTGVRAATPDGRLLVGRAGRAGCGLYLATGARRNGWLLAPLVARSLIDLLLGRPARPDFDPKRFTEAPLPACVRPGPV